MTKYYNGREWLFSSINRLPIFKNSATLFSSILCIRLLNSLTLRTFFQADEYWQSLEPAHMLVYGYGYLTWEWQQGIRSFSYPLLYSLVYKICSTLQLPYACIIYLPKAVDAIIASIGEYYMYKLAQKLFRKEVLARLTIILSLLSSFNWYCSTRSFSNTLELHLTTIAMYFYANSEIQISLFLAAFCCLIRPTNAIIWIFLAIRYISSHNIKHSFQFIKKAIIAGITMVTFDAIVNRWYYGGWKSPLLNFFQFNVGKGLSSFYGISRPDFYFCQAIPVLLLNFLPAFLYGLFTNESNMAALKLLSLVYILAFSFIQHKEFRFIYPLMPVFLMITSLGIDRLLQRLSVRVSKAVVLCTIFFSVLVSVDFSLWHESGEIAITGILREKILKSEQYKQGKITDVGFLTPCHSTPYQSYFHLEPSVANIWWLTCEPPLQLDSSDKLKYYKDESDLFYDNPKGFLNENFPDINDSSNTAPDTKYSHSWPEYLIIYHQLEPMMHKILEGLNYSEDERIFNSKFHWDYRRTGDIIIYHKGN